MEIFHQDFLGRAFQAMKSTLKGSPQRKHSELPVGKEGGEQSRLPPSSMLQKVQSGPHQGRAGSQWESWQGETSSRRNRMKKGMLSVGKLIPGWPPSVTIPCEILCLTFVSCFLRTQPSLTLNRRQFPTGPEVEGACQTADGSTSLCLKQSLSFRAATFLPPHGGGFYSPTILTNCVTSFVSKRTEIGFLLLCDWF